MSTNYPSDWDRRRKDVYKRDGYTCQNCGRRGGPYGDAELHAHHVVPKSAGGTHKKSNLKTVCKECHHAIHGDSVAPSATTSSKPEENVDVELDVDEFPYAAADLVEFGRSLEETTSHLETTAEALDDLLELLDMHVSLGGEDHPPRFQEQYEGRREAAKSATQNLTEHLDAVTRERPDFSKSTSVEAYNRFAEKASTTVALLEEYLDTVVEMIESDTVSESEFAEFQLLDDELDESVDEFVDSIEELMTATADEISHIVKDIRQDTAAVMAINPFDECPICGASDAEMQMSSEFELVRCTECRTEFQSDSLSTWEVIFSTKPIEGISLTSELWKSFDDKYVNRQKGLEKLQQASDTHKKGAKISMAAGFSVQLLGLISLLNGSGFSVLIIAILLSGVVGVGGVKVAEKIANRRLRN